MNKHCFVGLAFAVVGSLLLTTPPVHAAPEKLALSQPAMDGVSAGCRVSVQGRALLGPGEHLWVFAARKDFADLGLVWLQGEAEVDPVTQEFGGFPARLGEAQDVGSNFRVSVAILDEATHNRMRAKL